MANEQNLTNMGKGRKKGVPNKFTKLKYDFLGAFEDLGGREGIVDWAKKSTTNRQAFYQMLSRMLPNKVESDVNADGKIHITWEIVGKSD